LFIHTPTFQLTVYRFIRDDLNSLAVFDSVISGR
jgi:hypothetical protein